VIITSRLDSKGDATRIPVVAARELSVLR